MKSDVVFLNHQYFGVNWLIVWDVIENHLPTLRTEIGLLVTANETPSE
jgi:uncharacterized protein with HEPN domain